MVKKSLLTTLSMILVLVIILVVLGNIMIYDTKKGVLIDTSINATVKMVATRPCTTVRLFLLFISSILLLAALIQVLVGTDAADEMG